MQINTTTVAIMLLAIPVSAWSATTTNGLNERDRINTVLGDPLFSQSHMNLSFKNYWKYLKEEETGPKKVHNAWGQGVAVNYQSGYFSDIIGFDATYYGAVKLGASDNFNSRGVLYNNGSGNKKATRKAFLNLVNATSSCNTDWRTPICMPAGAGRR